MGCAEAGWHWGPEPVTDYFSHVANQGKRREVALDVVEFEPVPLPQPTEGVIEVHEHTEETDTFRRLFAELLGRRK